MHTNKKLMHLELPKLALQWTNYQDIKTIRQLVSIGIIILTHNHKMHVFSYNYNLQHFLMLKEQYQHSKPAVNIYYTQSNYSQCRRQGGYQNGKNIPNSTLVTWHRMLHLLSISYSRYNAFKMQLWNRIVTLTKVSYNSNNDSRYIQIIKMISVPQLLLIQSDQTVEIPDLTKLLNWLALNC